VPREDRWGKGGLRGLLAGKLPSAPTASRDEIQQAHELLRDYEDSGQGWFWACDAQGRMTYISASVADQLGRDAASLVGQPFHSLFILEREEGDGIERTLPLIFSASKTFSDLTIRAATDDREVWWSISGRPQFTASGEFSGYLGNGKDITQTRQRQRDASRLALFDSLTGLSNRHAMERRLTSTLAAFRASKRSCALMMLDLDRFKAVNDTLGHPAGDALLKQVAERLQQVVEKGCEIGRLGGDEFQVMLPDVDDRGKLGELAKKIIAILSQPYSLGENRCVIGASVGIAIAPFDGLEPEDLVRNADIALYAAKRGGRGQFRFFSEDLQAEAARNRQIAADLRDELAREEISLEYQPIIEPGANKVVALKAFLRWHHPDLGEVHPDVFLPIAEETKLIGPLGDWAIRRACEDTVQLPGNVKVAVRISAAQFANPDLPTIVTQALAHSELAPERLELELPEAILAAEAELSGQMFVALKILGVRLVLDQFGTGFSTLGNLRNTPFDKLKFGTDFIRGATEPDSRNRAIIRAIVGLAESLGIDVTADGIEARDELDLMRELKVSQIQGPIFADPVSFDDVVDAMASGEWVIEPEGPSRYRHDRRTVLRKVGVVHEDYRYEVTMRNVSRTGCLIEGLLDVPVGTHFVVDFGGGQLAVAHVRRSAGAMQGLEFEVPLVDDGAGGVVTRNRVSPHALAAAGMPTGPLPPGSYPLGTAAQGAGMVGAPRFAEAQDASRKGHRNP
jgi:diguanylate cyclase (GGDEF)-like protein/PAS domain S-box-containing protein